MFVISGIIACGHRKTLGPDQLHRNVHFEEQEPGKAAFPAHRWKPIGALSHREGSVKIISYINTSVCECRIDRLCTRFLALWGTSQSARAGPRCYLFILFTQLALFGPDDLRSVSLAHVLSFLAFFNQVPQFRLVHAPSRVVAPFPAMTHRRVEKYESLLTSSIANTTLVTVLEYTGCRHYIFII